MFLYKWDACQKFHDIEALDMTKKTIIENLSENSMWMLSVLTWWLSKSILSKWKVVLHLLKSSKCSFDRKKIGKSISHYSHFVDCFYWNRGSEQINGFCFFVFRQKYVILHCFPILTDWIVYCLGVALVYDIFNVFCFAS